MFEVLPGGHEGEGAVVDDRRDLLQCQAKFLEVQVFFVLSQFFHVDVESVVERVFECRVKALPHSPVPRGERWNELPLDCLVWS